MPDVRSPECLAVMADLLLDPSNPDLTFRVGLAYQQDGEIANAVRWYARTFAADEAHVAAAINIAGLLAAAHPRQALRFLRRSVVLAPDMAAGVANLGFHSAAIERLADVAMWLERARALVPNDPAILGNLGGTLGDLGALEKGARMARYAIVLDPAATASLVSGAILANKLDRIDLAIRLYRRSLITAPGAPVPLLNLRLALFESGDVDGALAAADLLAQSTGKPEHALMAAQLRVFDDHTSPEQLLTRLVAAHAPRESEQRPLPAKSIFNIGSAGLPRIGILDDRLLARTTHSTNVLPLMEGLTRLGVDLVFFTNLPPPEWDDMTRAYGECGQIVWTGGWSDDQLSETIRAADVGILIDTISHLIGRRSGVVSRRSAPVQIAYAAICSSGSAAIDYLVADDFLLPSGQPAHLRECVMRLPVGYLYRPLTPPPIRTAPPISSRGFATFGSFNALAKINDDVVAHWARLMHLVPKSRLLMKAAGFRDKSVRLHIRECLGRLGVAPDRLELVAWTKETVDHLSLIAAADVCLDPFPFNGMTTTFDALTMGVPVPTLTGRSLQGRIGESIARHIGATELIASSPEELVSLAAALAQDEGALRRYREELPQRFRASLICQPDAMAASFAEGLRIAWRRWLTGEPPIDIDVRPKRDAKS